MKYFKGLLVTISIIFILSLSGFTYGRDFARGPSPKGPTGPVDIEALYLEQKKEEGIYIAKGQVEVREGGRLLKADTVTFNDNTKEIFAEGGVVFQEEEDVLQCERLYLNMATKLGNIENGHIFIKKGNFTIVGDKIEKTGESEYRITEGEITTCEGERPAWKLASKDVKMTVEGYARTRGTRFKIKNITVFYIPWGIFPVKSERQSGLLLPELRLSSRDGPIIKNYYFWAISKDKDATFNIDYIGQRGIKPGTEFRYALRDDLKGSWFGSVIEDRKYDGTRYQIKGQHEQTYRDVTFKIRGNHVSDSDFMKDFGVTTYERSENLLKSTGFIEKPFNKSILTYEMSYFKSLTQKNNDNTFKYLPFASFSTEYIPFLKDRLYTNLNGTYTNFYREKGDRFTRMGVEPSVRVPLSFNGINLLVGGTLYETGYFINKATKEENEIKLRQTAKIEGDMNAHFIKNYQTGLLNLGDIESLIKPQVKYTFIPNTSLRDLPYIDPYDRLYQTNTITYGINHYMNAITPSSFREISLLEISQTYGLSGSLRPSILYEGSGSRFSDIKARFTAYPTTSLIYINESIFNTHGEGLRIIRNTLSHTIPKVYFLRLTHSYTKDLTNEIYTDIGGTYRDFDGRYQIRYSFKDGTWIDNLYQIRYHPGCWAIALTLIQSTRPRDTTFRLSFDLTGITSRQDTFLDRPY
ncbi:MAG: LPS assembly protein LptD [Syntrophorhabdaceae bacterium]|nr:LPS assembly protein LptD [Syntrophorhabdaceae bacterium]